MLLARDDTVRTLARMGVTLGTGAEVGEKRKGLVFEDDAVVEEEEEEECDSGGDGGEGSSSPVSDGSASGGMFDDPVDRMRWSFLTPRRDEGAPTVGPSLVRAPLPCLGEETSGPDVERGEKPEKRKSPLLPPPPARREGRKKAAKATGGLPSIKEGRSTRKGRIPPPLILKNVGPLRPAGLPPIVIEQIAAADVPRVPPEPQYRGRISPPLRDPRTGAQYIPPPAPTPPPPLQSPPPPPLPSIDEAALQEVLADASSREDFEKFLSAKTDGNDEKLLRLWAAANAHEEALNAVMRLVGEVQALALRIPGLVVERRGYPGNIAAARAEVVRRMAGELTRYLASKAKAPVQGAAGDSPLAHPDKLLVGKNTAATLHSPKRKKKVQQGPPGATAAVTVTAVVQTKPPPPSSRPVIPVRRRKSIVRVAAGSERKVVTSSSSSLRRSLFSPPDSRRSLHPSIERASSPSDSEPELVTDRWSKDSIASYYESEGRAYNAQRMSFAFTKDEVIRLSKVLEGEDHLKIVGEEEEEGEYGGIVEKLLDLGDDLRDSSGGGRRDTTLGLYDLYDR